MVDPTTSGVVIRVDLSPPNLKAATDIAERIVNMLGASASRQGYVPAIVTVGSRVDVIFHEDWE